MVKDSPTPSPESLEASNDSKSDSRIKVKRGRKPSQAKLAMLESKRLLAEKRRPDNQTVQDLNARRARKRSEMDLKRYPASADFHKAKKGLKKVSKSIALIKSKSLAPSNVRKPALREQKISDDHKDQESASKYDGRRKRGSRYTHEMSDEESSSGEELWGESNNSSAYRSDHCYDERDDLFFDSEDNLDENFLQNTDEDTEDASETDMATIEEEISEMKEQMYQDKIKELKDKIKQLNDGTLPEYQSRLKLLKEQKEECTHRAEAFRDYMEKEIVKDYEREKKLAREDLEVKKGELRETLISELNEKRKVVESEKVTLELTGGASSTLPMEVKPAVTRKLRRRPNDPPPIAEKKRKTPTAQLSFLLEDDLVEADLKKLNKNYKPPVTEKSPCKVKPEKSEPEVTDGSDAQVKDEKLLFNGDWYCSGDAIFLHSKEGKRFNAQIHSIGGNEIWIKKLSEGTRLKIYVSHLQKGKYSIARRELTNSKKRHNAND